MLRAASTATCSQLKSTRERIASRAAADAMSLQRSERLPAQWARADDRCSVFGASEAGVGCFDARLVGGAGVAQERFAVDHRECARVRQLAPNRPVGGVVDIEADAQGRDEDPGLQNAVSRWIATAYLLPGADRLRLWAIREIGAYMTMISDCRKRQASISA